jgi:hypothetical protein
MFDKHRNVVRALFCVTLLFFAIQLPLIYLIKREPYPALAMPSFAGHPNEDGVIEKNEAYVDVNFANGGSETIDLVRLLPPTGVLSGHVLRAFDDERFLEETETVNWLRHRTEQLFPADPVAGIDIVWRRAAYDVNNSNEAPVAYTPIHTIRVDFG